MVSQSPTPDPLSQSQALDRITKLEEAAEKITAHGQDRSQRQYVVIDKENAQISYTTDRSKKSDIRDIIHLIKNTYINLDTSKTNVLERSRLLSVSHRITQQYQEKRASYWDRFTRACSSLFSSKANQAFQETTQLIESTREVLSNSIKDTLKPSIEKFLSTISENGIIDTEGQLDRYNVEGKLKKDLIDNTDSADQLLEGQPNHSWLIERRYNPETRAKEYYFHQAVSSSDSPIQTIHIQTAEDLKLMMDHITKYKKNAIDKNTANTDQLIKNLIGFNTEQLINFTKRNPILFSLMKKIPAFEWIQYKDASSRYLNQRHNIDDTFFKDMAKKLPEGSEDEKQLLFIFLKRLYSQKLTAKIDKTEIGRKTDWL